MSVLPMEPMGFWELVKNNPQWFAVVVNGVFAIVTIGVIVWQVIVMRWQARNSVKHERIQNRLIRLQHEHEWILRRNQEREQLLKLGRELHLSAGCLEGKPSDADTISWDKLQDTVHELNQRLSILDVSTYSGAYDQWFPALEAYVGAVLEAVLKDSKFCETYGETNETPALKTREALRAADDLHKPITIFLDIEAAIRMEFFEFKSKWDAELLSAESAQR